MATQFHCTIANEAIDVSPDCEKPNIMLTMKEVIIRHHQWQIQSGIWLL